MRSKAPVDHEEQAQEARAQAVIDAALRWQDALLLYEPGERGHKELGDAVQNLRGAIDQYRYGGR